ncbi:MAG: galactokinase [Chloroflexota bacterium]
MSLQDKVVEMYQERFGGAPAYVVRAPGRVNLIGEHTDYNEGFVLPMAIEPAMYVALAPSPSPKRLQVYLADLDYEGTFDIDTPIEQAKDQLEYVKGVTRALLNQDIDLAGWQGVMSGDVPMGSGLSSSAAFEMAVLYAYKAVNGFDMPKTDRAKLGQWVENHWVGVNSGILDQMAVVYGTQDKAVMIDCRSLETDLVDLPNNTAVAILDTGTRRTLDGTNYNERREQCEAAAAFLGVPTLRDVTSDMLEAQRDKMDDVLYRRTRHILTENARVLKAVEATQADDAAAFGVLMNESHASMRDDFEISSVALDAIVKHAVAQEGCYGARMTGGGFAGCAVALIDPAHAEAFGAAVKAAYDAETGNEATIYITTATDGAKIVIADD